MQKYRKSSKNRNLNQIFSKLISLISLKISANLYVLLTDIQLNFCQNRIDILWKIKIHNQIQNQFPVRAHIKAL